jgi:hypothetical protein
VEFHGIDDALQEFMTQAIHAEIAQSVEHLPCKQGVAGSTPTFGTLAFKKYQHLERFGTDEVENIELGECYVFPKLDGTNSSVWLSDGEIQAGSRNRHLTADKDNAGFHAWATRQDNFKSYLAEYPSHRLFGEWLIPHSLKTYKSDAWRQFYVFDVAIDRYPENDKSDALHYLHYEEYAPILAAHGITHIPPICKLINGSYEQFVSQLRNSVYLIEDGQGHGEGIVIKQYGYRNKYGRTTWAKIVSNEFKEQHVRAMGANEIKGEKLVEDEIVKEYVTVALVEKEYAKIALEGWNSRQIPRLLSTVFYTLITEESWNFVKKHKNPMIDFSRLQHFTYAAVKRIKPELF